jgi:hypothetical protein
MKSCESGHCTAARIIKIRLNKCHLNKRFEKWDQRTVKREVFKEGGGQLMTL